MTNHHTTESIEHKLTQAIAKGEVHMRPRWHFVAKTVAMIAAIILLCNIAFFSVSLIHFSLNQSGMMFAPMLGFMGFRLVLMSLPWILVLITIGALYLLHMLTKQYSYTYKRPLVYTVGGIIVVVALGTIVFVQAHVHSLIFRQARMHHMQFAPQMYRHFGRPMMPQVYRGTVTSITTAGIEVRGEEEQGSVFIHTTPTTRFSTTSPLTKGMYVVVFTDNGTSTITALGVQRPEVPEDGVLNQE